MYSGYRNIPDFYDRVKNVLGVNGENISDSSIDFPEQAPLAEDIAKSKVPNWETLTDEKTLIFEKVVVLQTASLLYPQIKNKEYKIKQTTSMKIEYRESLIDIGAQIEAMLDTLVRKIAENIDDIGIGIIGFDITQ